MEKSQETSAGLLRRYLAHSSRAPFEIHQRYQNRLVAMVRKRLDGTLVSKLDPEDAVQETFQTFFEKADSGEVRWQVAGDLWRLLAGIAINKVKQKFEHFTAAKRNINAEVGPSPSTLDPHGHENAAEIELAELVDHILNTEKPIVRSILELRLGGFNNEEIGKKIGRSSRTVRRVIESLQAKLIADNGLEYGFTIGTHREKGQREKPPKTPLPSPSKTEELHKIDYNDFQLLRLLGQGGFAKAYLAKRNSTGELLAIKAIRKKWLTDLNARTSFFNEAKLLESLDIPNVVKTYGIGTLPNGGCFLLLEFIDGQPILEAAKQATSEVIESWIGILDSTMQKIHEAGIVHGDIRPANILVDSLRQVRFVDFGLASRIQGNNKASIEEDLRAIEFIKQRVRTCNLKQLAE